MSGALSPEACAEAWARYGHLVRARCRARLGDAAQGDEALTETFRWLLRAGGELAQAESPLRLLFGAADRTCARLAERRSAWGAGTLEPLSEPPGHPSGAQLDALSAGEPDPDAASHVEACPTCAAELRARDEAGLAHRRLPLPDFLAAPPNVVPFARPAVGPLAPAEPAPAEDAPTGASRRQRGVVLAVVAVLIVALTALRPSVGPASVERESTPAGAPTLWAVRERAGQVTRANGEVLLRPGDRLRFEIALDGPARLAVALFPVGGAPLRLVPDANWAGGTHLLDAAVPAEALPAGGWLYVGPPDAVGPERRPTVGGAVTALRIALGE